MRTVYSNSKEKIIEIIEGILDNNKILSDNREFLDKDILKLSEKLEGKEINQFLHVFVGIAAVNRDNFSRVEYFLQVSSEVLGIIPVEYFLQWCEIMDEVFSQTPKISDAFLRNTVAIIEVLKYRHIDRWGHIAEGFDGDDLSEKFICKTIDITPLLVKEIQFEQFENLILLFKSFFKTDPNSTSECLNNFSKIISVTGVSVPTFVDLFIGVMECEDCSFKEVLESLKVSVDSLSLSAFIKLIDYLALLHKHNCHISNEFISDIEKVINNNEKSYYDLIKQFSKNLVVIDPVLVQGFVRGTLFFDNFSEIKIKNWYQKGYDLCQKDIDSGTLYFTINADYFRENLIDIATSIDVAHTKAVFEGYCRALTGVNIDIALDYQEDLKNNLRKFEKLFMEDRMGVLVPGLVNLYSSTDMNHAWLKVRITHQIGHIEFDTFGFSLNRKANMFENYRNKIFSLERWQKKEGTDKAKYLLSDYSDLAKFISFFDNRDLAMDVFTILEDGRVDRHIKDRYKGIADVYKNIQQDSLERIGSLKVNTPNQIFLDSLLRYSLDQDCILNIPVSYKKQISVILNVAQTLFQHSSSVEDTAEATIRIYTVFNACSSQVEDQDSWQKIKIDDLLSLTYEANFPTEDEIDQLFEKQKYQDDSLQEYESFDNVEYRRDLDPRIIQFILNMKDNYVMENSDGNKGSLEKIIDDIVSDDNGFEEDVNNLQKNGTPISSDSTSMNNVPYGEKSDQDLKEESTKSDDTVDSSFKYDEWDFKLFDYKKNWCTVTEKLVPQNQEEYFEDVINKYGLLARAIKNQFEALLPFDFRKQNRLYDGEELNIEQVIEEFVNVRAGYGSSERFYMQKHKNKRDVAVLFLVDVSASTAESIDLEDQTNDLYLTNKNINLSSDFRRIIDVEKESLALLFYALENLGDRCGIYAFSGYGRDNVELFVLKELEESMSDVVKSRIGSLNPMHATRMGPAIRHATMKLDSISAKTKLLFLISDGRPQDRGYSREGVEKEYAVHDTKKSLEEAKTKNINTFCLTVDKKGHDYLQEMCQGMGYEVLDSVDLLPTRLLYLYRKLTT